MQPFDRSHLAAVAQALLVTVLWSSSWVLIKVGLDDIPALTFAGLRYFLAFLVLLPMALRRVHRGSLAAMPRRRYLELAGLGLLYYTLTQGALFVALAHLPAVAMSLTLNFTPLVVALAALLLLGERPGRLQWLGMLLFLFGAIVYFLPFEAALAPLGVAAAAVGLLANSASSVLGRAVNRRRDLHPMLVTVVSMGLGATVLLGAGLAFEGLPDLDARSWTIVVYLATVNTALAFTLWNHTLRRLTAAESSVINNTMLIQIAFLAWWLLDEPLSGKGLAGILLAALGALLVQLRQSPERKARGLAPVDRAFRPMRRPD